MPTGIETHCPDNGDDNDDGDNEDDNNDEDSDDDDDSNTDGDLDWFDLWRLKKRQRFEGRCSTETLYSISTSTAEDDRYASKAFRFARILLSLEQISLRPGTSRGHSKRPPSRLA